MTAGENSIAGEWQAAGSEFFHSVDPRTRQPGETRFYSATAQEIDAAVRAAADAFASTRLFPATTLADFLDTTAEEIEACADALIATADAETALGSVRLNGELARTTGQLRAFSALLREGSHVEAVIDTALPERTPLPRPDIRRMLLPLGPVAVFSASNFPFAFATAGGDSAAAFAAGCPVIVKGHPGHPATSELFAHAINAAVSACGFPPGCFSLLQGDGHDVGRQLVEHPFLEAVGFTGSLNGGRALHDIAAQRPRPIPVFARRGSTNPVVITAGALAERSEAIVQGLAASATLGVGQFCTNPGLVLLPAGEAASTFITACRAAIMAIEPGILLNAAVESGLVQGVRRSAALDNVQTQAREVRSRTQGFSYPHTVMQTDATTLIENPDLQEEHFGPVTLFVTWDGQDELDHVLRSLGGQLTGSIHCGSDEAESLRPLLDAMREKVGRLVWNGYPTGVDVTAAMHHGGPWPASNAANTTSVGSNAIRRFLRPVAWQDVPDELLPEALQNSNPLGIVRLVNGELTRGSLS
ncbi:MAG: aldehyde dehydrogenase (NADP(+)) [Anaerolineaceae bacterium]|nr:aldehyde dehydrogenase (NADP(+)) [Anaerolineaceae bacterium]